MANDGQEPSWQRDGKGVMATVAALQPVGVSAPSALQGHGDQDVPIPWPQPAEDRMIVHYHQRAKALARGGPRNHDRQAGDWI